MIILTLRFFGQGVLTMASQNMMVKWFDKRRGFAMSFSSVALALVFSLAPLFLDNLIQTWGWRGAWFAGESSASGVDGGRCQSSAVA